MTSGAEAEGELKTRDSSRAEAEGRQKESLRHATRPLVMLLVIAANLISVAAGEDVGRGCDDEQHDKRSRRRLASSFPAASTR